VQIENKGTTLVWPDDRSNILGSVQRQTDMELDRALELAVVSSWEDLVKPGETCSVHVEYKKVPSLPLDSLEVWTIRNRGYGTIVCRFYGKPSSFVSFSSEASVHFANSYHSKILANNLAFILENQGQFTRPADRSIHGLVQIDGPTKEDRSDAAAWTEAVRNLACSERMA